MHVSDGTLYSNLILSFRDHISPVHEEMDVKEFCVFDEVWM